MAGLTIQATDELRRMVIEGVAPRAVTSIKFKRIADDEFEVSFYHGLQKLAELPYNAFIPIHGILEIDNLDAGLFTLESG